VTTEQLLITIIAAIAPTIAAIAGLIVAVNNRKQNKEQYQEIHLMINSRMDKLLELTGTAEFARGAKSETDKQLPELDPPPTSQP